MLSTASREPSSETPVEQEVESTFRQFAHWIERATSFSAKRLGLHVTDLSCVSLLYANPQGVTPKDITEYVGISSGAATALIDRLERSGHVRRMPNPGDRRSVVIQLVPGNTDSAVAFFARQQAYKDLVREFSASEMETILRFMRHLTGLDPSALIEDQEERLSAL